LSYVRVVDDGGDEKNGEQGERDANDVNDAANTLSAFALWIEKYRLSHGGKVHLHAKCLNRLRQLDQTGVFFWVD
jgi:hypothetical protein